MSRSGGARGVDMVGRQMAQLSLGRAGGASSKGEFGCAAVYLGTVSIPPNEEGFDTHSVVKRVTSSQLPSDQLQGVKLGVTRGTVRMVDLATGSDMKLITPEMFVSTHVSETDPRVVVLVTRVAEVRVPLKHGHVFAAEIETVKALHKQMAQSLSLDNTSQEESKNSVVYYSPASDIMQSRELITFDSLYLGYVRVSKKEGSKVVKKAIEVNAGLRSTMESIRLTHGKRKIGILRGGAITSKEGVTVEDDPCTIIITPRSLRIVDRLAGETLYKTLITGITFSVAIKGKQGDLFGMIVVNERLGIINCHLFRATSDDASKLHQSVTTALKQARQVAGGDSKSFLKQAPWQVPRRSNSGAAAAAAPAAPSKLYAKQLRRTDLNALAVIGMGEYGQVYLALQSIEVKSGDKGPSKVRVPRAVKMMRSAADEETKQAFIRETMNMVLVGDHPNVVRLIGVAVEEYPWLAVLEFVRYGDLRAVLQACKEDGIELHIGEMINFMRQLSSGLAHISSMRLVHMDVAARNTLLGHRNIVKVGDFGMSRPMCAEGPYLVVKEKVPLALKWMSIEAMDTKFFSEASDCWSFGVTMWEILTYGEYPFGGVQLERIQELVREGRRLSQPATCPDELWEIILRCWGTSLKDRWKFVDLTVALETICARNPPPAVRDIGATVAGASSVGGDWSEEDPTLVSKESASGPGGPVVQASPPGERRAMRKGGKSSGSQTTSRGMRSPSLGAVQGSGSPALARPNSAGSGGRSVSPPSRRRSSNAATPGSANSAGSMPPNFGSPPRSRRTGSRSK